jgi:hypothetical protein
MAKSGFDYSKFVKFVERNKKMQLAFVDWLRNFLLERALEALALVRPMTPVRTGNLRRSWSISNVEFSGGNFVVYLVNPVEYASYMEYGFTYMKKGAPAHFEGYHMAEIAISEVTEKMPEKFKQEFAVFLKQYGWG